VLCTTVACSVCVPGLIKMEIRFHKSIWTGLSWIMRCIITHPPLYMCKLKSCSAKYNMLREFRLSIVIGKARLDAFVYDTLVYSELIFRKKAFGKAIYRRGPAFEGESDGKTGPARNQLHSNPSRIAAHSHSLAYH
jgi:hypothetical protein